MLWRIVMSYVVALTGATLFSLLWNGSLDDARWLSAQIIASLIAIGSGLDRLASKFPTPTGSKEAGE